MHFRRLLAYARARARMSQSVHTRIAGRWLFRWRVACLFVAISSITLPVLSIPIMLTQAEQVCSGAVCDIMQLRPQDLQTLEQWGIPLTFVATSFIVLFLMVFLAFIGLGALLCWHKSVELYARFFGLCLMFVGIQLWGLPSLTMVAPAWRLPLEAFGFLTEACGTLFAYLFPNGRFVPCWTRWAALAVILVRALVDFFPGSLLSTWPAVVVALNLGPTVLVIVAQVSRYRHHSTPVERQQTKWVLLALMVVALLNLVWYFVPSEGAAHLPALLSVTLINNLAFLLVPLAIALYILRYRLWEIDTLINKVLVYGLLTALLTVVYAGLILGSQALLRGVIEQTNDIALVVSTLAIATLFQPLRRRLQSLIDRRFYRQKYDATKTLAAFSAMLRTEVDVAQLSEQVVAVVQKTMQPTFVSLWLVKPEERALAPSLSQWD